MYASIRLFVLGLCLVSLACSDGGGDRTPAPGSAPAPGANPGGSGAAAQGDGVHAPAGYVPGSYEDWCGSHEVPESACTRCNPALAAAFQATGDWCTEHGLPESHCLICNPNLVITRPPRPEGE